MTMSKLFIGLVLGAALGSMGWAQVSPAASVAATGPTGRRVAARIVHVEIGSKNSADLAKFYNRAFGWTFDPAGPAQLVTGGAEGGPTIMLNALGHPPETYVLIYIEVADIEAALRTIAETGGSKLVGPGPLPDGRRFAWVRDPAGNMIALLTPKP
jgi:uncharacterized protein